MALIKGNNGLGKELYDALGIDAFIESQNIPNKTQAKADALAKLVIQANVIIDHIIANMEIKNVSTSLTSLNVNSLPPDPTHVADIANGAATQSNNGTGHVL